MRRWQWLAEKAREHDWKLGAELGVKEGRTTEYLSAGGIAMIAVDLWQPQIDREQTYLDWDHEKYLRDFRAAVRGRDVTILRMMTDDAAAVIEEMSLDFVFIDADHSYEGVKSDIEHWAPKVRPGGAICGHDYNWTGITDIKDYDWPGVRKAVDEAFTEVEEGPDKCWLAWK
jgi:hypothetical protein